MFWNETFTIEGNWFNWEVISIYWSPFFIAYNLIYDIKYIPYSYYLVYLHHQIIELWQK